MAERARMTAAQLADKLLQDEHADVLRESVAWMARELMEADVSAQIGAELGERSLERTTHRNGYRSRDWDTRVGSIELAIPKLRQGSYFPSFLEPRRRAEQALVAVVQEAYVNGVSTRKVDRLVEQMGLHHLGKDQVSRLCRGLDEQVQVFRERPLEGAYPYLWLDAKVERVRERGGVRHKALVIAYGVHESGRREVIGLDVGEAETESFWWEFLRGLRARGLDGVKLAVSDAHAGLKQAIAQVVGCPWQRCTVHFLRDLLGHVSRAQQPLVSGAIRGIFTAASAPEARTRLAQVVRGGTRRHGKGWGWFFSAPDPATGKRRFYSRNGFSTKKAAQEALSAELARFHNGAFVEPSKLTVEAFLLEQWLPAVEGRLRPSTRANYKTNLQVHIIPALGALKRQRLTAHASPPSTARSSPTADATARA
jgi:putative transposase